MLSFKDDRNAYFPSVPIFFNGELPIIYESYMEDSNEYGFVGSSNMLLRVKLAYYDLSRDDSEFPVVYLDGEYGDDFDLNETIATREIRFGDFSDVLNTHYIL